MFSLIFPIGLSSLNHCNEIFVLLTVHCSSDGLPGYILKSFNLSVKWNDSSLTNNCVLVCVA
jgi:hypothetical protein